METRARSWGWHPNGKDTYRRQFEDIVRITDSGFRLDTAYLCTIGSDSGIRVQADGTVVTDSLYAEHMLEIFGHAR